VRSIGLLILVLLIIGYLASVWDPQVTSPGQIAAGKLRPEAQWVRTNLGWEKRSDWIPPPPVYHPPIHPLALAGLQGLLSLAALIAFPSRATMGSTMANTITTVATDPTAKADEEEIDGEAEAAREERPQASAAAAKAATAANNRRARKARARSRAGRRR